MEKFLLIVREDLVRLGQQTSRERLAGVNEMMKWVRVLAEKGHYLSGEALDIKGSYVRRDQVSSDGPFIEAKEGISGFMLIGAKGLDEATSITKTCPLVQSGSMVIEVRPLMEYTEIAG